MNIEAQNNDLHRIVILNPKGGSGKTTLATNLASYFALRGPAPTLIDCDPLGYSMTWLKRRPTNAPPIHAAPAYGYFTPQNRGRALTAWPGSTEMIIDLPAGLKPEQLYDATCDANSILIPVNPSEIDVYSTTLLIADLLLVAQVHLRDHRLGIIANRARPHTKSYRMLMRFISSLEIPLIAELRDSQNFVHAAAQGLGVYELPRHRVRPDIERIDTVVAWLDKWRGRRPRPVAPAGFQYEGGTEVLTPAHIRDQH